MTTAKATTVSHTCPVCGRLFEGHPLALLPETLVERAFALIRQGYSTEVAAATVGCTGKALRNHLRRRGLSTRMLRGPSVPILIGRFPCRFCGQPTGHAGAVCEASLCRQRAWEELPEAERAARINERRRGDRYARQLAEGLRVDVHILLPPEAAEELRAQAAMRGQSISSLVAEALVEVGFISTDR